MNKKELLEALDNVLKFEQEIKLRGYYSLFLRYKQSLIVLQNHINSLPEPRTKEEIIRDFRELGYSLETFPKALLFRKGLFEISIHNDHTYKYAKFYNEGQFSFILPLEHKLISELLEVLKNENHD